MNVCVRPPQLTLVTGGRRLDPARLEAIAEAALAGGADCVLLREKTMDSARLLALAARLRRLTRRTDARLIVHGQADVALAVGADGVHVAAADIPTLPQLRVWLGSAEMSLSASCHSMDELRAAAKGGADFALLSPVFPTRSHPGAPHLGAKRFLELADAAPLPVVALGGITPDNRGELDACPVAVIGAILDAGEPEAAARALAADAGRA